MVESSGRKRSSGLERELPGELTCSGWERSASGPGALEAGGPWLGMGSSLGMGSPEQEPGWPWAVPQVIPENDPSE